MPELSVIAASSSGGDGICTFLLQNVFPTVSERVLVRMSNVYTCLVEDKAIQSLTDQS